MRKQLLFIIISLLIIGCSTPAETSPTPRSVPTAPVATPEPAVVPEPVTPPVRTVAAPEVLEPKKTLPECKSNKDPISGIDVWCFDALLPEEKRCWFDKGGCLALRAGELEDASACEALTASINKGLCFSSLAERTKDVSLCDRILDAGSSAEFITAQSECIGIVAGASKNKAACGKAKNADSCYNRYASAANDISACALISAADIREGCEFWVNQ